MKLAALIRSPLNKPHMSRSRSSDGPSAQNHPLRHRAAFRFLALSLPFLLLGLLEVALRLAGRHTPTHFWLSHGDGSELTPNTHFADAFVGRTMARMPRSNRVRNPASPGTLRIVVFGESAALGDPEPGFGMSRCLEALLEARFQGKKVEVINTAVTALNSYAIREAARDSRRLNADFWIVYAGNNEVIGPFGPASSTDGVAIGRFRAGLTLGVRSTALGQWLTDGRLSGDEGLSLTQRWTGLELFSSRQIGPGDPRLASVHENFQANLDDIVRLGTLSGARVLLGTMAVNLVDCAPFGSTIAMQTNDSRFTAWQQAASTARASDDHGTLAEAIGAWQKVTTLWPDDAESRFRLGIARLNSGDMKGARADLEMARDLDTIRLRADSELNQRIRKTAQTHGAERVRLVDADRELHGEDAERPPGVDLFWEHVHLRPEGNYRLARLFAENIAAWMADEQQSAEWLALQPCLERIGWNPFAAVRLWGQIRSLTERPPFTRQSNAELRSQFLDDRIVEANRAARPANRDSSVSRIQTVVSQHPGDWHLREQLARLLQSGRRWKEAAAEWRQVVDLAPGHVVGWFQLGESLSASGDKVGAQQAYERALEIRPDFVEASVGLGFVLGEAKQFPAALGALDRALRLSPANLQARVNRGVILVAMQRPEEAISEFKRAAAQHPESPMPLMRLGEFLADQKSHDAAAQAYSDALKRETNNAALQHRVALELSLAGRTNEAEAQFKQIVAQVPNSVLARMDYGVALARQSRFQEASVQFEEALRLQPTNTQAQTYLQQARSQLRK